MEDRECLDEIFARRECFADPFQRTLDDSHDLIVIVGSGIPKQNFQYRGGECASYKRASFDMHMVGRHG